MTLSASESQTPPRRSRLKAFAVLVVVCLLIAFVVRTMAPQTLGEQARRVLEKQLAEHYRDWDVSIRRGVYRPGVGLQFEDITLSRSSSEEHSGGARSLTNRLIARWSAQPEIEIDRLTVVADIDARKLLDQRNPMATRRVVIDGVRANLRWQSNGNLSLAGLWPPPQLGPICPKIDLRQVTLNLVVEKKSSVGGHAPPGRDSKKEDRPMQFRWSEISIENTCEIVTADSGYRRITLHGESDLWKSCDVEISQTVSQGAVSQTEVESKIRALQVTDSLADRIATWLPHHVPEGAQFDLTGDLGIRFKKHEAVDSPEGAQPASLDYEIDYVLTQGRYADPRLPNPIQQASGRITITPNQVQLFPSEARLGQAVCRVEGSTAMQVAFADLSDHLGTPPRADVLSFSLGESRVLARIRDSRFQFLAMDLRIDKSFRQLLPARTVRTFDRFQPVGQIDFVVHGFNPSVLAGSRWSVAADVQCEGVSVQFDKFPYPVESLSGRIRVADGRVDSRRLTGVAGGRPIHCEFNVPLKLDPNETVSPEKSVVIRSNGAVPIDNALVSALTPRESSATESPNASISKLESFVRSLQPRGGVELASASVETNAQGVTSRQFDMRVVGGTMRYERFAYPLYNVTGRIQVKDDLVRMIGFTANNAGAAKIACDGLYQMPSEATTSELNLRFRVADIAMDHTLRVSLPESSRTIWEALTPAGTLDELDVQVHQMGKQAIELSLSAAHQNADRVNPNTLSIRPEAIPYRIDITSGNVDYRDGVVTIKELRGRHDASHLIADGVCRPDASGRWLLTLDLHSGCRLIPDEELIAALPEQMRWAMRGLDLRGPLGLRGETNILLAENPSMSPAINWDLILQLEGNRIADVGPIHSLRGEVMIRGIKSGDLLRAGGQLAIDSLHAYGLQVTALRGPFSILGDELRLGTLSAGVDPISGAPVQNASQTSAGQLTATTHSADVSQQTPIIGKIFDGQLNVNGVVALSSGDFDVGVAMVNGQIATILAEMGQTRSGITGRFDMNTRLDGRLGDFDLLKGAGTARISGANIYELPLLVQVLNLLRITPTEDVAFTDAETEYSIFGADINFNRLSMWGDLVALDGSGTLSRLEHLDLSFNTKVSPQNMFSKVISPLRDNSYTFWTIEVDGPISAPTIQRHALGGVSRTLESWFPGMIRSTTANTSPLSR